MGPGREERLNLFGLHPRSIFNSNANLCAYGLYWLASGVSSFVKAGKLLKKNLLHRNVRQILLAGARLAFRSDFWIMYIFFYSTNK